MAYHADNNIPPTIEDWLDRFDMFSIYEILPEILKLWGENMAADVEAKNFAQVSGKIVGLELLTIGLVLDIWTEKANDGVKYRKMATQQDFDKF
ncbi:MAG: hypothetical protein NC180_05350 [Muribaculaceae bacterium]|nr:hypothetical protein [Muribaculaceae bacterium]MCM1492633.1 hypothetical protein [Muribaculaceae bacterium]